MRSALALVAILFGGCSASDRGSTFYIGPGAHGVGMHMYTWVDSSRATPANGTYAGAATRTLPVQVWWPAMSPGGTTTDAPVDVGGPFPLIVHSHGFMDNRMGESYLAEHLASHGYVVAAPDFPLSNSNAPGGATIADAPNQPGDVKFVIDQVLAEAQKAGSPIAGAVDGTRIGVSGLSLGGLTTLLVTFHDQLRDSRVQASLALAPVACLFTSQFYQTARTPLVLVQGDADLILPYSDNAQRAFGYAQSPSELVTLARGSHTGFAGLASLLDPTMNYDRIGCSALTTGGAISVGSFSALGGASDGIATDSSVCPAPCQEAPMDPSLDADRQHDLTDAIATAHFDHVFRMDAGAGRYLAGPLQTENPEVTIALH